MTKVTFVQTDKLRPNLKWVLLATIVAHLSVIKFDVGLVPIGKDSFKPKPTPVKFMSADELAKIKRAMPKQIVRTDQTGENKKDPKAKYLGKSDQFFNKQTMAAKIDSYQKGGRGNATRTNLSDSAKGSKKKSKKVAKKAKKAVKKKLSLSDLGAAGLAIPTTAPKAIQEQQARRARRQVAGTKNGDISGKGIAANNDFIEDVELGDITRLNTVEYKYFGFYERIRTKLEQYWGNSLREKARAYMQSGRRLPANENLITALTIFLNSQGEITKVLLKGSSGLNILDDAAIESFNKAGPFPNPPKGMLKDGHAKIQWSFVVKS